MTVAQAITIAGTTNLCEARGFLSACERTQALNNAILYQHYNILRLIMRVWQWCSQKSHADW